MCSLRQRIRKVKISCNPWKRYNGEIKTLCISGQCLFSNEGMPWDILETELIDEGWLLPSENLWECLVDESRLKLKIDNILEKEDPFDDTWTEEDYRTFYKSL